MTQQINWNLEINYVNRVIRKTPENELMKFNERGAQSII